MTQPNTDKAETGGDTPTRSTDALDAISVAAFEVDARIFRTMWHTLSRPNDVVRAGLTGDFSIYLSPMRVFVALFSVQFAVAALFGAPSSPTLDMVVAGIEPERVDAWLASAANAPIATGEINAVLARWTSLLAMPITVLASLPYLLVLKLYRPSLSWWGHTQTYLIPVNSSFVILFASLPLYPFFPGDAENLALISLSISMIFYFIVAARVVGHFYSRSALGLGLRVFGLFLLFPVSMAMTVLAQFFATNWALESEFGLSVVELISN